MLTIRAEYIAFLVKMLGFALSQMDADEQDEIFEELKAASRA